MHWPAGWPIDAAICGYCHAPIVRGQIEHECGAGDAVQADQPTDSLVRLSAPSHQSVTAAQMAEAVDRRLNARDIRVGDKVRLSADGRRQFSTMRDRRGVVTRGPRMTRQCDWLLIDVKLDGNRSSSSYSLNFWELDSP